MKRPHPECEAPHLEDSVERMKTRIDQYFAEREALLDRVMMRKIEYVNRKPLPRWALPALGVVIAVVAFFMGRMANV
jgi:hypothetical protein